MEKFVKMLIIYGSVLLVGLGVLLFFLLRKSKSSSSSQPTKSCNPPCTTSQTCKNGVCVNNNCTPNCPSQYECGSDGCGGTCPCPAGFNCSNGECVSGCVPNCPAGACGSDGCGGECPGCPPGQNCVNGKCECVPSCPPGYCGSDGCGGQCPACLSNEKCVDNKCVEECDPPCPSGQTCVNGTCQTGCIPKCPPGSCGSDGCGGQCPACPTGQICENNICVVGCGSGCPPGQVCQNNTCTDSTQPVNFCTLYGSDAAKNDVIVAYSGLPCVRYQGDCTIMNPVYGKSVIPEQGTVSCSNNSVSSSIALSPSIANIGVDANLKLIPGTFNPIFQPYCYNSADCLRLGVGQNCVNGLCQ